jgi:integrase
MILGERPDDDTDRLADDDGGEVGEWLDGLRTAGLPVRSEVVVRRVGERAPSQQVQELLAESWSPRTRAGYEADWVQFAVWCHVRGIDDPLTADEIDVAEWVATLVERHLAIATIRRYLAAVGWAFEATGRTSPTRSRAVRQVVAGASRRLGTTQRRAEPLRLEQLRRIIIALPVVSGAPAHRSPRVRRDQVLLAVGWAAALRSEELVGLDVDDITITGDPTTGTTGGMLIRVRRSKGDQTQPAYVAVPWSTHPSTCPVRLAMLHIRQIRTGPLFRHIDRHGTTHNRLQPKTASQILKQHVSTILQANPDIYSSHSLRAGFVTEARAHRIPDTIIARHTRHKDLRMLGVYDRPTDLFNDPALTGEWW